MLTTEMESTSFSISGSYGSPKPIRQLRPMLSRIKSMDKPKLPKKMSSRWSLDFVDCESMNNELCSKIFELKSKMAKSNDPASLSSLDRLSLFFRFCKDKENFNTQDNCGRFIRASASRTTTMDTLTSDMGPWSKTEKLPLTQFCTCSKYVGEWNVLGIAGEGVYEYPHGVIYDGNFNANGLYHGAGTLIYPNGQRLQGVWENGVLTKNFYCGSEDERATKQSSDTSIFRLPDRRFPYEHKKGFGVPGKEYLTNEQPTPEIPENCYDLVGGIYCPATGYVISHTPTNITGSELMGRQADEECEVEAWWKSNIQDAVTMNNKRILEIPSAEKAEWIKKYCRSNPEQSTGYNPALYEVFIAGTKKELDEIQKSETFKNDYAHTCPDTANEMRTMDKRSMSFVPKVVVKEKRKRTVDMIPRVSRLVKKKSALFKKGPYGTFGKTSEFGSGNERELLLFYGPMGRRRSVIAYLPEKFGSQIKERASPSIDASETFTLSRAASLYTIEQTENKGIDEKTEENVLSEAGMKKHVGELFTSDMKVTDSVSTIEVDSKVPAAAGNITSSGTSINKNKYFLTSHTENSLSSFKFVTEVDHQNNVIRQSMDPIKINPSQRSVVSFHSQIEGVQGEENKMMVSEVGLLGIFPTTDSGDNRDNTIRKSVDSVQKASTNTVDTSDTGNKSRNTT